MQLWNETKHGKHGGPHLFSNLAITMAFMVEHMFSIPLLGLQKFISKRDNMVHVMFKTKIKRTIQHLLTNSTWLQAYDESKWKVTKHSIDGKR
nr:hypothetical protein [Candidatus Enterovibrio luxaltus]